MHFWMSLEGTARLNIIRQPLMNWMKEAIKYRFVTGTGEKWWQYNEYQEEWMPKYEIAVFCIVISDDFTERLTKSPEDIMMIFFSN